MSQSIGSGPNRSIFSQNSVQESKLQVDKTIEATKEPLDVVNREVPFAHKMLCAVGAALACKDNKVQYDNFYNQCTGLWKNSNEYQKK